MNDYQNMRFVESLMAVRKTDRPVVHHHKRWYNFWLPQWWHDERQDLLNKQHGFRKEPCAYLVHPSQSNSAPPYIMVHPALALELKQAIDVQDWETVDTLLSGRK